MDDASHVYAGLTPDLILDAVEAQGQRCSGHLLALNSYENRVYQIGLEAGGFLVAKFYRPGRWSDAAILEEHAFSRELAERDIPVVQPLTDAAGVTLFRHQGFRFALYPRQGGRWPNLDDLDNLLRLGRLLGRIHAVGAMRPFSHRPRLDPESFGVASVDYLLGEGLLPAHIELAYRTLTADLLQQIESAYARAGEIRLIRLHGDCHPGNILWTDDGPHFVDLDDCRSGPAIQDLWMLLSGERREMAAALSELLEGYQEFHDFDYRELQLIEALRTLRMIHYAAWLARRRDDPAFQQAFPWFGSDRYWEEHILALREQAAALNEPPLNV
ncbi:serine/threonine protein kinase [Thiohalobacter sp. IOR34]|uniref:serine/threonine protein kinase n=1 Tax=Thiohalobacter sp. IOR34 TaxID=3057176 RepID=UPI0025B070D1|nr:serine/threonine protein kinase [Thiohalobacter sp. IOR34]WJW75811.1 serine/threonine protein kinase [Thiohalobacter sp. IOR34]